MRGKDIGHCGLRTGGKSVGSPDCRCETFSMRCECSSGVDSRVITIGDSISVHTHASVLQFTCSRAYS